MRQTVLAVLGVVVLLLGLSWVVEGNDFFLYKVFAPRRVAVERQTFEESKSYNQGMIQELQNMRFQYVQADEKHKDALADVILHRTADYDENKLPPDLRQFVQGLKLQRVESR